MVQEYAEYSKSVDQKYLAITDHGVMGAVPSQIAQADIHDLKPIFGCFPKDTPVFTKKSIKSIDTIKAGELVLTHKGRYRRVMHVMERLHKGYIYEVKLSDTSKHTKGLRLTGEHPILIRDEFGEISFVKTEDIQFGRRTSKRGIQAWKSYVCFPRKTSNLNQVIEITDYCPENIGVKNGYIKKLYTTQKYESLVEWKNLPTKINLDLKLAKLLGLYTAEGSVRHKKNKLSGTFTFSYNYTDEQHLAEETLQLLDDIFGVKGVIYNRPEKNIVEVIATCLPVAYFFANTCGVGAKNKKIPEFIFNAKPIERLVFATSLLEGDGKDPLKDPGGMRTLKVSSRKLAYDFKRLMAIEGDWLNVKEGEEKGYTYYIVPYSPSRSYKRFLFNEDYVFKPIKHIKKKLTTEKVYNIQVDEDESYVTDFAVHNCEFYINPLQPEVDKKTESAEFRKTLSESDRLIFDKPGYHLLGLAYNFTGYQNLVRLSSWAWIHGFYKKPRLNHEILQKHKEGIIFTSTCGNSEIAQAYLKNYDDQAGFEMIQKYLDLLGKEHFYLELMMLDWKEQKKYDGFLIRAHDKFNLPLIISTDCHYCKKEDSHLQQVMLIQKNRKTLADIQELIDSGEEDIFELQDSNLWMKSEKELNTMWETSDYRNIIDYELFKQAKANTVKICEYAAGVELDRTIKLPQVDNANTILLQKVMEGLDERKLPKTQVYLDRLKEEYRLICRKGFASYFLIQKEIVDQAREISPQILGWGDGSEAVGPGRGCLDPEVPILTENGCTSSIKNVQEQEKVLTLDGTFKSVSKVLKYKTKTNEKLLNIKVYYGDAKGVSLTKDHKIYAEKLVRPKNWNNWSESTKKSRKSFEEPKGKLDWYKAEDLSPGDWCYIPDPEVKVWDEYKIDLKDNSSRRWADDKFVYNHVLNTNTIKVSKRFWHLDKAMAFMLGFFVGDGWTRSSGVSEVGFCSHSEEKQPLIYLEELLSGFYGCQFDWRNSEKKKLIQMIAKSFYFKKLIDILHPRYQHNAHTKHIPDCILNAPKEIVWSYLHGYFLADGSEDENKIKFETTSYELACQIRYLLLRVGLPSSISYDNRKDIREEYKNSRESFVINCPLNERVGSRRDFQKQYNWRKIDGGILVKIREISEIKAPEYVYDLEIKDNHNYQTSSFLVHNSVVGSLIAYCLFLHDVEPIHHDLLFSRFLSPARGGKQMKIRFKQESCSGK